MREVLFVAYWFPPMGGSGVIRALKFAKYLPQFGWKPTVLTVKAGDAFSFDQTLLDELPPQVTIERVAFSEVVKTTQAKGISDRIKGQKSRLGSLRGALARFLRSVYFSVWIPDNKVGWIVPAVRQASRIQHRHSFEAIYATSPPQTSLLVATIIRHRLGIPLVSDYRDEWTTNPHKYMPNPITLWLNRYLEKLVADRSDALLVMSQGVKHNLRDAGILKEDTLSKCRVLPNGFDPADYGAPTSHPSAQFRIVYTGSFYGELRIPDPFLRALYAWLAASPHVREHVHVLFQGSIYPQHQQLVYDLELDDVVRVTGSVPHHQAIAAQQSASILLLVMGKGEGTAILPGKVFEYLGAQRPILAVVHPSGESANLVRQTDAGVVVDPDDTGALVHVLADLYAKWEQGSIPYTPDVEQVNRYSRVEQARQLSDLFEQMTQR
jgi:glycosyltransferase involved in cell wall biosynthesis